MQKKILTMATALLLSTVIAGTAAARDGWYAAIRGGITNSNLNDIDDSATTTAAVDFDNVWMMSGAIGYRYSYFRAELEYTYRNKIEGDYIGAKHKVDTMSMMINGYYDIDTGMALRPFVNLAIGASRLKIKDVGVSSKTDYKFSWGGGVGVGYDITKDITFDVGYRFQDLGKQIKSNEFYGGLRFAF